MLVRPLFPGSPWALALELLPVPGPAGRHVLRALPDGAVLLSLSVDPGSRPRAARHSWESALWRPRRKAGGWVALKAVSVVRGGPALVPVSVRSGSLAAVLASLCPALGLSSSGRIARAVLQLVPSDMPSFALGLSVLES